MQASLRSGATVTPNGLLAIKLPSYPSSGGQFPQRLNDNLLSNADKQAGKTECFARQMTYPQSTDSLVTAIEAAFERRTTQAKYIVNPRERFSNSKQC